VRTRPIKGTRAAATDPEEDRSCSPGLLASEKDQAELAMIVDLLRNDLGKVAATRQRRTGPFPEHASFAQVHHLFATVTAQLRPEVSHRSTCCARPFPAARSRVARSCVASRSSNNSTA
jgi:anthranilate/para-aminobenzoate synthase component I